MKKLIYALLPICVWAIVIVGCSDDSMETLSEAVPLKMAVNNKSLVMGDHLIVDFTVDGDELTANEDFDIYLTAKKGADDVSETVFESLPEFVTFKQGEKSLQVDLTVKKTGITSNVNFEIVAFARGYRMTGNTQSILVSDYHRTVVSLKDNPDQEVQEGETFTLVAMVGVAVAEPVVIVITPKAGEAEFYENLPASLTIPSGGTTAESGLVTIKKDGIYTGDKSLTVSLSTESAQYPLMGTTLSVKMKDLDKPFGERLQDERWVYDNPEIPFASTGRLSAVNAKYGTSFLMAEGNAHPNAKLAEAGWTFYNAQEFHLVGKTADMWTRNDANDTYVPIFLAAQSTATTQASAAVDITKFSTIADAGYLKMFEMKIKTIATGGASGQREYGTAAFYANNQANAFKANHTPTLMGSRVEVRARIRGNKKGFNMAIWMLGNTDYPYGEIDLLENPANNDGDARAFQTFHIGADATSSQSKSQTTTMNSIKDWNIYWMEWVDDSTVRIGLNGDVTTELKKGDLVSEANWPFSPEKNPKGLKLILTMGAPSKWAFNGQGDSWVPPVGWDSGFANFTNYVQDRDNDAIPRMEIDWIRTYINMPKAQYEKLGVQKNGTKFY